MGWAPRFRLRWEGQRTRESGCLSGGWPIPNLGDAALCMHGPLGAAHWRAEKNFLAGEAGQKMDLSLFRRLRPAEVCDACPPGRGALDGGVGEPYGARPGGLLRWAERCGRLRRVPYRASPLDGVFSGALRGESGWVIPLDGALRGDCGVCPTGRVHGTERLAKVCDAFWVRCGNGFPAAGPCFRFGKNFFGSCPHIWRGSSVIQGERGRSHHGLGGPI